MSATIIVSGSAMMSKLVGLLDESRWRGELTTAEHRWLLDQVASLAGDGQREGNMREFSRGRAKAPELALAMERPARRRSC